MKGSNRISVSAPGKLMLFGEHAVLYSKPCIVIAVEPRMNVTVKLLNEPVFQLEAPDLFVEKYEKSINAIGREIIPREAQFVESAVKNFLEKYPSPYGVRVKTKSEFSSLGGLGSSSACVVSVLFGLYKLFKKTFTKKDLFDFAYKTVLDVQKTGSGFDVAAAVYGGTVYFKKGGAEIISLKTSSIPVIVAFSGTKADTVSLIKKVAQKTKKDLKTAQKIFNDIKQIVESAKIALETSDFESVGKLMNHNQELLEKLGVSNSSISNLIEAARKAGAYGAKLSGAGGGDCVIALYDGSKNLRAQIEQAMEKTGGKVIDIKTNVKGVRIDG